MRDVISVRIVAVYSVTADVPDGRDWASCEAEANMVYLSIILKPLGLLLFYSVARFLAYRIRPLIPARYHKALYTTFTDYAQQKVAQAESRARQKAPDVQERDS